MGRPFKALGLLKGASNWQKCEERLLKVAQGCERIGSYFEAETHYHALITKFPSYADGLHDYCRYAIAKSHPDAQQLLDTFKQKFPDDQRVYLLFAQYLTKQNKLSDAQQILFLKKIYFLKILP